MAQRFGNGVDLQLTPLYNAVIQNLASAPAGAIGGLIYYDTAKLGLFAYAGAKGWRPVDAALLTDGSIPNVALAPIANTLLVTNPLARANHTGTQAANTIVDLATVVKGYTLDTFAAPITAMNINGQQITNVANATSASAVVNLGQMQAAIVAAIAGQTAIKNPVRAYAAGSITLSGLQTVDGVSLAAGDTVAAGGQSTATQINIYTVASGAWTIRADCASGSQWSEGTEFLVAEGSTYGGSIFRQTTTGAITIGTTALGFVQTTKINTYTADGVTIRMVGSQFSAIISPSGGLTSDASGIKIDKTVVCTKLIATITGNGSATSFTLVHNLSTAFLQVGFQDSSGAPFYTDWVPTAGATTSSITITFANPPANGVVYTVAVFG